MRILGLDVGSKTIGVACSDALLITAQGVETIRRKSDEADFARLPVLKEIYDVGEETNRLIERMIREAVESGFAEASVNPAAAGMVFWSGICGLISISANKEAYFSKNLGLSRKAFLQYGFEMLLNSVRIKEKS